MQTKSSIVGSIGVISSGFGFTGLMDKLGIERRTITAGKKQGSSRSISTVKSGDENILGSHAGSNPPAIHRQGERGARNQLHIDDTTFTGLV